MAIDSKSVCTGNFLLSSFLPHLIGNLRTHHWDRSSINLPVFLAKTGYKEPQDAKNSNYADHSVGHLDFFGKCVAEPAYQESFSIFMKGWARYKVPWPTFYDTGSLIDGDDLSNGGVLCVDIGGHHGIDLTRLLDKHPDLPAGSLVLEDLPEVVKGATDLNEKIRVIPHDMFQPQPVKGRSYDLIKSYPLFILRIYVNYLCNSRKSSVLFPRRVSRLV